MDEELNTGLPWILVTYLLLGQTDAGIDGVQWLWERGVHAAGGGGGVVITKL